MIKNTKELYDETYKLLNVINNNPANINNHLSKIDTIDRNKIINLINEYKLVLGFNTSTNMAGNFTLTVKQSINLSAHGFRFLYFYEKYHDSDLDIISLLSDTTGLVEKITSKEQFSNLKQLLVIIVTALITSYCSTLFWYLDLYLLYLMECLNLQQRFHFFCV